MERDEEIIKASTATFKENGDEFGKVVQLFWMSAFIAGAKWADEHPKNVCWHDASEEPIYGRDIIAENINGYALSGAFKQVENNKGVFYNNFCLCDWSVVIKWMYVFDILPRGGQ